MACKIEWHKRGVYLKYSGKVNLNKILELGNTLLSDRKYDNCIYEISDFSEVTDVDISEQDIKVIATWDRTVTNFIHLKHAIVVHNRQEFFQLTDMYLAIMSELKINTERVEVIDEAYQILKENHRCSDSGIKNQANSLV